MYHIYTNYIVLVALLICDISIIIHYIKIREKHMKVMIILLLLSTLLQFLLTFNII